MKRYFVTLFFILALCLAIRSCQQKEMRDNLPHQRILPEPTGTYQSVEVTPTPEGITILDGEEASYVSQEIYTMLKEAKASFEQLKSNGTVSQQMRNSGTSLIDEDARVIDDCVQYLYELTCGYVSCYEANDFKRCMEIGKEMVDFDSYGLNQNYLFDLMVAGKLPEPYKYGHVYFNEGNSIYDGDGNINMSNGYKICMIGGEDAIVCPKNNSSDPYNRMVAVCDWYRAVPNIINDQYTSISNEDGNPAVCYFWNQTKMEKCCRDEWAAIKKDGADIYHFNPDTTSIIWADGVENYVYCGNNGEIYGELDSVSASRVKHLYEVQDAIVSHTGNVHSLNQYVCDMQSHFGGTGYYKA